MSLSPVDRKSSLRKMREDSFDLVIIGGGITGAGAARDAASRGMTVALIEARDFASGTSSRSSKLIHGGIRYLENLEFHLVFEALSERQKLFDLAPHLVHPLRFILPVYKGGRVPAWKMGMGMWAYDALSLFEAPELHVYMDAEELHQEFPALQTAKLDGGFAYYDAYMDDDRLVLETLRSARDFGAEIANYAQAVGARMEDGRLTAIECEADGEKFLIHGRHFIGSVGPWTDILGKDLFKSWKAKLRPSKGVHLTFTRERFPLSDAFVMGAESRIVFAIPRHEMVIVGTTDTDFPGDPARVRTEKEDVDYLLKVIDQYFPGAKIERKDIVATYAGVRPLIHDGAQTESKTSREHEIWTEPGIKGCTFVAGGKYTTYRNMAQQTVAHALNDFSITDRARFAHTRTVQALNPLVTPLLLERAMREHTQWAEIFFLPPELTGRIAGRHGLEGREILMRAASLRASLSAEEFVWAAEAMHAVEHTMCAHLSDFFARRSPLVLSRKDHGAEFIEAIAGTMAAYLGWNETQKREEINALQKSWAWEFAAFSS